MARCASHPIEAALDALPPDPRPAPFWLRIAAVLRAELREGAHPPGQALPGEHALAARFGAARMTLRRAMGSLEAEGWLRREAGRGAFPAGPAAGGNTGGLAADMSGFAGSSRVAVLALGLAPAPPGVARALGLAAGEEALRVERVRRDARGPFSHVLSWVPADRARRLSRARLEAGVPLSGLLAARGAVMTQAEQAIGAAAAAPDIAAALGVAIGAPLVRLERTLSGADGRAFEHGVFLYRPDRFAYSVALDADGQASPPRWVPVDGP